MDVVLLPFLQAATPAEREHHLSDLILILVHVTPIVRRVLRHKLGFSVTPHGHSPHHDAEDLYHDIIANLIALLNQPQLHSGQLNIRNFRQYVTRISTCRLPNLESVQLRKPEILK